MGSGQFQREYIEYLQDRNSELLNKLSHMKENYENKIFSKDMSKHYLLTALEDVLDICTTLPQEIDLFFEKMSAAMEVLTNILLRKSEMVQLVDKISRNINPSKKVEIIPEIVHTPERELSSEVAVGKKGGTVKVSPMINGHVITTDPKIYISKLSKEFTFGRRNESHQLSPIIEASPDAELSDVERCSLRELRIPLERLNLNKLPYLIENSPKSRFTERKTWKKSVSLKKQESSKATENGENQENLQDKTFIKKDEEIKSSIDADPLEGPSWLYDDQNYNSDFIDYRRRKHRFASVFDRDSAFVFKEPCKEKKGGENKLKNNKNGLKHKSENNSKFENCYEDEDYVSESFSEKEDEKNLSCEKILRRSSRKCIRDSSDENDFLDNGTSPKKKITKSDQVTLEDDKSIHRSDSNYEADSEENSTERKSSKKSYRKRRSKRVPDKTEMEQCLKTESMCKKEKPETSEVKTQQKTQKKNSKSKSGNKNSTEKKKFSKEIVIELEDCMVENDTKTILLKKSPENEKKGVTKIKRELFNFLISPETEGRKKRKAAPTNLSEPSLNTKLRRD